MNTKSKYMVAKIIGSNVRWVAIDYESGYALAEDADLVLLHCYMEKLGYVYEELE